MLDLEPNSDDDPDFVALVNRLIAGTLIVHGLEDARIFKIDNWFDHKWVGFSGIRIGGVGVWRNPLTVPPFVVNRIVQQWHYRRDDSGDYTSLGTGPNIHHRGWSGDNLWRHVQRIAPNSGLFWYSGNTSATGRGSLMGYIPVEQSHWTWFLGFVRGKTWKVARRKNIYNYEIRSFMDSSGRAGRDRALV